MTQDNYKPDNEVLAAVDRLLDGSSAPDAADDALLDLAARLAAAAPQPDAAFQKHLQRRLQEARAARGVLVMKRHRFPMRAAVVAAVLVLIAGTALAVAPWIRQLLQGDPGMASVYDEGQGIPLHLSQTIDGYTVTLDWAYADGNRLTLAYTITGLPGVQYTNLETDSVINLTLRQPRAEIPGIMGMGNWMDGKAGQPDTAPTANFTRNQFVFDLSGVPTEGDLLDLRLELEVYGVPVIKRTQLPIERFNDMKERPGRPFVFEFSVPLSGSLRVLDTPQTAADQGITLTLESVTVSPSQVRVAVCYDSPDPSRGWTSIPRLTAGGADVPGGGGVQSMKFGETRVCDKFLFNADMDDYQGGWRLEISELVGFGSGGGNDQQRIKGAWVFEFVMP